MSSSGSSCGSSCGYRVVVVLPEDAGEPGSGFGIYNVEAVEVYK